MFKNQTNLSFNTTGSYQLNILIVRHILGIVFKLKICYFFCVDSGQAGQFKTALKDWKQRKCFTLNHEIFGDSYKKQLADFSNK